MAGTVLLSENVLMAQPYGNEWIAPGQRYYKIVTGEEGIYRVTYSDLLAAGFPVSVVNPRNIRLFHRGREHSRYIKDELSGVFDSDDFIEFYGKRNDGTLDRELYVEESAHSNKYHNLFSDSTAYFLTWSLTTTGKRMQSFKENNVLNLPPETYHYHDIIQIQASEYNFGLHYPLGVSGAESNASVFDFGEGWTGTALRQGQFRDLTFSGLNQIVPSGPNPIIEILLTGRNNLNHNVDILVGSTPAGLRTLQNVVWQYHYDRLVFSGLEWSDLSGGNLVCRVVVNDVGSVDRVSIKYARLVVPYGMNHESVIQRKYSIPAVNGNRSYLELQNVPPGSSIYDITDESEVGEIGYNVDGSGINAMIQNNSAGRKLLVTSRRIPVSKVIPLTMRNLPANPGFIIITSKHLRKPAGSYSDVVKAYAGYRASPAGGSYDTLLVNVEHLYDMFSYGEITPLAIYRFARYMASAANPAYIFIIGKGLTPNYNFYRRDFNTQAVKDLVPTAGYPGSDILFTAGLKGASYEPGIPIGRIASDTPADVLAYIEKVSEMESLQNDALWRKELVHLSGGADVLQQTVFKRYVDNFKQIAEGPLLGGFVSTISKRLTGTTEFVNISDLVNSGKLLITFFGHSATTSTDLDIGLVSDDNYGYRNKGKYPFMLVNGCIAGDMYNTGTSGFGEDWINTPNRGAVGFMAHSANGLTLLLRRYSDLFYEVAFSDSLYLNKGIGDIQKETGRRYLAFGGGDRNIAQVQQMALQGDPSLTMFGATHPDYEISQDQVFVESPDGQAVNIFSDFKLGMIIRNFGRTRNDSITIVVSRSLENNQVIRRDTILSKPVFYLDTIYVDVPALGLSSSGNNTFTIQIDPGNTITELNKMNNQASYTITILADLTKNLFPYNYSIISDPEPELVVQALNTLSDERQFIFELDTSAGFNSPNRKQFTLSARALAKWEVSLFDNLPETDTITFFWRSKFADVSDPQLDVWNNSSFTYIRTGGTGWAMMHHDQFHGNELEDIVLNDSKRRWEFEQYETSLQIRTFGASHPDFDFNSVQLVINTTEYIFPTRLCTNNSMNFVAFDKSSTIPYLGLGNPSILERKSCGRIPQIVNNMLNNEIQVNLDIEKYIDAVREGDYVLAFSIGNVTYENWPASTLLKLEEIGVDISAIQDLSAGEPVIFLGRKGMNSGEAQIIMANPASDAPENEQEISLITTIDGTATNGVILSPMIGPAANWETFIHQTAISEWPQSDQYYFNIYGINRNNAATLLFENVQHPQVDLSAVNPSSYPFLRLELYLEDQVFLTPAQLKKWIVIFEGLPDGILLYKDGQPIRDISKTEGELHESVFIFDNYSRMDFKDSVMVEYSLFNIDQRTPFIDTLNISPVLSGNRVEFSLVLNTLGKSGINDLRVFANPAVQSEHDYNNNLIFFPGYLNVRGDNTNPIMEVTVDGTFIMNGDIVSPTPLIVLRLKDENKVLPKQDTAGVNLYLTRQCDGCTPVRANFSSANVVWSPATASEDFRVEYQPNTLEDGIYTLKAEAADATGNESGSEPYTVTFEVINESQITNFYPYPNPFSTRTQFVFTLTGSEIPDDIIIQIMTVNGTVVREITMEEIGPIRIGNNRTEYAWDGRDEYGDQLANGVYLYQVKILKHGTDMKHRATAGDRAFKHGFGKLYLLR